MSLAIVHSRALDGVAASGVSVEVHLANSLTCFILVGLAETGVRNRVGSGDAAGLRPLIPPQQGS